MGPPQCETTGPYGSNIFKSFLGPFCPLWSFNFSLLPFQRQNKLKTSKFKKQGTSTQKLGPQPCQTTGPQGSIMFQSFLGPFWSTNFSLLPFQRQNKLKNLKLKNHWTPTQLLGPPPCQTMGPHGSNICESILAPFFTFFDFLLSQM